MESRRILIMRRFMMVSSCLCGILTAFFCVGVGAVLSAEIELPEGPVVMFEPPSGFQASVVRDPAANSHVIKFVHYERPGVKDFSFTVFVENAEKARHRAEGFGDELIVDLCAGLNPGSAEGVVPIQKSQVERNVWYCSATDARLQSKANLPPGTYRHRSIAYSQYEGYGFMAIGHSQSVNDQLYQDFLYTMRRVTARGAFTVRR